MKSIKVSRRKMSYPEGWFSKEQKEQRKQEAAWKKEDREREKQQKAWEREQKALKKKELELLNFMLKHDVLNYHHGRADSMKSEIKSQISFLQDKELNLQNVKVYHPYVWNYYGEGHNYMFRSQLGCLFSSSEFNSIHDVPLDGTYKFYIKDSGQRGLGSFDYIYASPIDHEVIPNKVNPGAFPF